jgi:hypothetical protein
MSGTLLLPLGKTSLKLQIRIIKKLIYPAEKYKDFIDRWVNTEKERLALLGQRSHYLSQVY